MKILLPLDIVNPPELILEYLQQLVPLADKEVHLLYVNEAWPAYENVVQTAGKFPDDWRAQVEARAQSELKRAADLLQPRCLKVDTEVVSGPPAMMIETVARDEHADMTVLCPGKHPVLERIVLGSVSAKVLKHAPGTILICRPLEKPVNRLRQVLMGVDGSANSKEALRKSIDQFNLKDGTKILLVHSVDVADPIKYLSPVAFISALEQNLLMEGETILADAKRILCEAGIEPANVDVSLVEGKAHHQLMNMAETSRADLIVIGAEGRTAIQHFLLGSVSHKVARYAPCAVAVVKRSHQPAEH